MVPVEKCTTTSFGNRTEGVTVAFSCDLRGLPCSFVKEKGMSSVELTEYSLSTLVLILLNFGDVITVWAQALVMTQKVVKLQA